MCFHENLIRARRERGMTQEELAVRLNVSRQAVSKWETNESLPDLYKLAALADALGTTTDALCGHDVPSPVAPPPETLPEKTDSNDTSVLEAALHKAARQNKLLSCAAGILTAVCLVLAMLLLRGAPAADVPETPDVPALPDTIEVSGLRLSADGAALVVRFVPSVSGEGIDWSVGIAPSTESTSVTTTVEDGICTARIAKLSPYASATLSATVTNGRESRSLCLATQVNVGENRVSWVPEV